MNAITLPTQTPRLEQIRTALGRSSATLALRWLELHNRMGLPRWMMPLRRLRQVDALWSDDMRREYIRSGGTKLPHDEPCQITSPADGPKVEVDAEHRLSSRQVADFYRDGFLKPFKVFDPQEIRELGQELRARRQEASSIYGYVNDRDRHLEVPSMLEAMRHPAIVERLAQLLGRSIRTRAVERNTAAFTTPTRWRRPTICRVGLPCSFAVAPTGSIARASRRLQPLRALRRSASATRVCQAALRGPRRGALIPKAPIRRMTRQRWPA